MSRGRVVWRWHWVCETWSPSNPLVTNSGTTITHSSKNILPRVHSEGGEGDLWGFSRCPPDKEFKITRKIPNKAGYKVAEKTWMMHLSTGCRGILWAKGSLWLFSSDPILTKWPRSSSPSGKKTSLGDKNTCRNGEDSSCSRLINFYSCSLSFWSRSGFRREHFPFQTSDLKGLLSAILEESFPLFHKCMFGGIESS